MKKKSILLVVLLITIGFAAVSTTLIMNGVINITSNTEDFDVYFSEAILDNIDIKENISKDKKTINFSTKNLKNVGDIIVAKTRENGKVTVELTKASINEQNINFTQ